MITSVVCAHNREKYIRQCIDSCLLYTDEVLVFDDGSTDDTPSILATYDNILVTRREVASGNPVWGSNLGMQMATGTHLVFVDDDNWLTSRPPETETDYVFAPISVVDAAGRERCVWRFPEYSLDPREAYSEFQRSAPYPRMPFPWGGIWRTDFLRGKSWRDWDTTQFAADFRTAIDWCKDSPSLAYVEQPWLVFRLTPGQWSEHPDRDVMYAEARVAQSEVFPC